MTSGYALAVAIFGGFAPFISVWLISTFDSPIAHSFYLIAAAIVSTIVICDACVRPRTNRLDSAHKDADHV